MIRRCVQKKINRSGTWECPICNTPSLLSEHHLEGRKVKQANKASNKANICYNCHARVHNGDIIVEGWFMTSEGMKLLWHKKEEESLTGSDKKPYVIT